MLNPMKTLRPSWFLALCLVAMVGCTHTPKMRVASGARIQDSGGGKIPLHVCLLISEEFRGYEYKFENMGDTWLYPFGVTAQEQSISLCQQTFESVTVVTNGVVPAGVDAVLDPLLLRTGMPFPVASSSSRCAWSGRSAMRPTGRPCG